MGASVTPLIDLRGITKQFVNGELVTQVLHSIDVKIYPGEFVAIMGASGSGKSTLMNILGCLDRPTTGQYLFNGRDVANFDADELAQVRREAFGFVFQSYNLLPGVSAVENVEMPAIYSGLTATTRHERAVQLLASLGLGERIGHKPSQLSGGQQQRVSIARALMNGGSIILADEPTGALDSHSGREVMKLLAELSTQGHTVILITHDPKVGAHADRLIEISDGKIVADPGSKVVNEKTINKENSDKNFEPDASSIPPMQHGTPSLFDELYTAGKTAVRSLFGNVFRTILTLLGIVIGVASVITMMAIGDGAKQTVVDRISSMGSNLLMVRPGGPNERGGRWSTASLTPADVDALNELDLVMAAVPEVTGSYTLRYETQDHSAEVNATSNLFPIAKNWSMAYGTFFTEEDEQSYSTVAVIGKTVADKLFPTDDPLGQYIIINNILFQVIGVTTEQGASARGDDQDNVVFIPYTTGMLRIFGQQFLRSVTIAVGDTSKMNEAQAQAHTTLMSMHGKEDFQIFNMASLIDTVSETQNTMTLLLASIAAISLLVGGIGVMNIMLVSVTERTREIGIRMATGARRRHILQQFLTEALVVSAMGGVIGVVLGVATAAIIGSFGTPIQFSLTPIVLAFGCAFLTGLIFGFLPARKAAHLDPVQALASE
jgi:macrolide transport system ATP-binding/permease protein